MTHTTTETAGPIVIVFGNEKGGTGKSTLAMHLAAALMARGATVSTIDLDAAQGTLTRYLHHRREFARRTGRTLAMPTHAVIHQAPHQAADEAEMVKAIAAAGESDVIIIDTPGHASELSLAGHSYADIIVTPMNDSLIDLDVLARVDPEKLKVQSPSHYAERIWKAKQQRARRDGGSVDWIVVRNRVGALDARNKRRVASLIGELSKRIGCRIADGIGERVIFRELFLDGLTVEDLSPEADRGRIALSHVAARAEIRTLLNVLGLADRAWKPRADALSYKGVD